MSSRWMAGGVLCALALAGTAIVPTAGGAQEPQQGELQGEADLAPSPVAGGGQVTASDSSCFEGTTSLWWALRLEGEVQPTLKGTVPLAGDGGWEVDFTAPNEGGDWLFFAICLPPLVARPDALIAHIDEIMAPGTGTDLLDAWDVDGYLYYAQHLEVEGPMPPPPPTTAPPVPPTTAPEPGPTAPSVAPPAAPTSGDPTFTG